MTINQYVVWTWIWEDFGKPNQKPVDDAIILQFEVLIGSWFPFCLFSIFTSLSISTLFSCQQIKAGQILKDGKTAKMSRFLLRNSSNCSPTRASVQRHRGWISARLSWERCWRHASWSTHSEVPEDQVSRASAKGHESCTRMIHNCFWCSLCWSTACRRRSPLKK